jgi:hypothetical protein
MQNLLTLTFTKHALRTNNLVQRLKIRTLHLRPRLHGINHRFTKWTPQSPIGLRTFGQEVHHNAVSSTITCSVSFTA